MKKGCWPFASHFVPFGETSLSYENKFNFNLKEPEGGLNTFSYEWFARGLVLTQNQTATRK